jgi:hypothetical protein
MESVPNSPPQLACKTFEALSVCADTNLKLLRHFTDFSANVAKEGISLCAELQSSTLEAIQEGQGYVFRRLSASPEALKNPLDYYQRSLHEFMEGTEKAVKLFQNNAQALLRATEQYWLTARQTGNGVQTCCTQLAEKLRSLCMPA